MSLASILDIARRLALVEQTVKLHGFGAETARAASHLLEGVTRLPPREVRAEALTDVGRLLEDPARVQAGVEGLTGLAHGHLARHHYSLLPNADPTTGLRRLIAGRGHRSYPIESQVSLEGGEVIEPPPPRERLPIIDAYLRSRLDAVGPVVARLDKVLTWSRSQEGLSGRTRSLLGHVEEVRTQHERLRLDVERLDPSNASRLSRTALTLHPNLVMLEHELGRDPLVRSFLQSDIVNGQWGREVMARPDDPATLAQLGDLSEGPARALLVQYFQYLRAAKGGDLGPFSEQPFDPKVLAVAIVRQGGEFDRATVQELLDFVHQRWRLPVPSVELIETAVGRVRGEMAELWNHHAALSGNAEVVPPERGDSFSNYLERFPLFEWDDLSTAFVGVGLKHALSWGSADSRPRDIGAVIHLHRCIAEEGARRMAMYGTGGGRPQIPDLLEMVRLAYGERARGLFESRDPADPNTLLIEVPEAIAGRSYGELFHANVLRLLREDRESSTRALMDTVRRSGEKPIMPDTLKRHERGIMAPHRRMPRSRTAETALLELLGGSRALDAFLEFQPAFNQVAEIVLPNGQVRTPPGGARTSIRVRLVSSKPPPIIFAADRPVLEPSVFPFRWLLGERSRFHLLVDEVGACLLAARGLSAESPEILDALERDFLPMQAAHPRLAATLPTYLHNSAVTPFDAVERYERFYRNLLLLSGRVFRIELKEEPALIGAVASVIRGEGGGPEDFARLLRLRLGFDAHERRGSVRSDDLPVVVASMFPELEPAGRDLLVRRYKNLRLVEEAPVVTSGLGPENPEVAAIMEAALRRNRSARGGLPSPKWLSEQLGDFLRIRYGIPPSEIGPYLQAVSRYFELNPRWHEAFRPDLLDQAFLESGAEGMRDDLTAFLYLMGAKLDDALEPDLKKIAGRSAASPVVVAKTSFVEPPAPPLPAGLIIPTALGRLIAHFGGVHPADVDPRELPLLLDNLARRSPSDLRSAAGEFLDQRGAALGRPFTPEVREGLIAQATALFPRLSAQVSETIELLPRPADPLARIVAEVLVHRIIFSEEPINLPALTAEVLRERRIRIGSSGYNRALEQVTGWFGAIEPAVARDLKDLLDVFELAVETHPKNRDQLFAAAIQSGKGAITPFEGVRSEADLDPLVRRYERLGVLFAPEKAASLHEVWETLLEFYPPVKKAEPEAAAPRPSPPRAATAGPAEPVRRSTAPRIPSLPPRQWNPTDFTLMTDDQWVALRGQVIAASAPRGESHLIFYVGDSGLECARVDPPTYRSLVSVMEGKSPGPPLFVQFTDLVSGRTIRIPSMHIRQALTTSPISKTSPSQWLASIGPDHPMYPDLLTVISLVFQVTHESVIRQEVQRIFADIASQKALQTGPTIRAALNQLVTRRRRELLKAVAYYRTFGPWAISTQTARGVADYLNQNPWSWTRYFMVASLIDEGDHLPEITGPFVQAVRRVETIETPGPEDYQNYADAVTPLWPVVMRRYQERFRAQLGDDPELLPIVDAPEVVFRSSIARRGFIEERIRPGIKVAKRLHDVDAKIFAENIVKIATDPDLVLATNILILLTQSEGAVAHVQFRETVEIVNRCVKNLETPEGKRELTRELVRLYLRERPKMLHRLWDLRNERYFEWVPHLVPEQTSPKFSLSGRFPELEEVPLPLIDSLRDEMGGWLGLRGSKALELRKDGFSRMVFVPLGSLVLYPPPPSPVSQTVGLKTTGGNLYFTGMSDMVSLERLIPGWQEGGEKVATLQDLTGRRFLFSGREVVAIHLPARVGGAVRREAEVMRRILNTPELADLHPILVMLQGAARRETSFYDIAGAVGSLFYQETPSALDEIRNRVIGIYASARASFQQRGYDRRFTRHIP